MNIAKQREEFSDISSVAAADVSPLTENAFSLPAAEFVDTWAKALALTERDLTTLDRDYLVNAIRTGTNRLKILDALHMRQSSFAQFGRGESAHDIRRTPDRFALMEVITRFAPDDDGAFLRRAFLQICDREPTPGERLELEFDLRRGHLDRRGAVKRIVAAARRDGHLALWDSLDPDDGQDDPACARTMPAGLVYDESGRETLIFVRAMPDGGWMVAPDIMRQSPKMSENGWLVHDGWLLVGPKRSFRSGTWRVDLDLLQLQDAILDVDIVANSGLDVLQRLEIIGPFSGSFAVEFKSEHRFVELRLAPRKCAEELIWLKPRNISMQWVQ